jgi:hypothetical protein
VYRPSIERHERLYASRAPVPVQEVTVLRALLVGLLALILVTQAAAATMQASTSSTPSNRAPVKHRALALDERLEHKLAALHRYRGTIHFFRRHRSLLGSSDHRDAASAAVAYAERRVRALTQTVAVLRGKISKRDARRLAAMSPKKAICDVFGSDCAEALAVARCESRLSTTAQNGEYLGLFQMGTYARSLFGHGSTAREQAVAARRYFVRSGRDWSPWSCRWAVL